MSTIRVIYAAGGFDNSVPSNVTPQAIFDTLTGVYAELKKDGKFVVAETAEGTVMTVTLKEGQKASVLA